MKIDKNNVLKVSKISLTLCAITAISALVLAVVNEFTAPVIAENTLDKKNAAMQVVVPQAENFKSLECDSSEEIVSEIYEAVDDDGNTVGYAVMCNPNGYGGEISMAVGIDNNSTVIGVDIVSQSETAGLGSKCTSEEFREQFKGKSFGISVVKNGAKDNQIDAISSATVTSKAVTKGVNSALEAVDKIKGDN